MADGPLPARRTRPADLLRRRRPLPTRAWSRSSGRHAPYTEADLQAQVDDADRHQRRPRPAGPRRRTGLRRRHQRLHRRSPSSGRYFPGEYVLTGEDRLHHQRRRRSSTFKLTDLVALASVVGALFGSGGGGEVRQRALAARRPAKYGVEEGTKVWESFRERNDPEAVLTVHDGESFPYAGKPAEPAGRGPARRGLGRRANRWCTTAPARRGTTEGPRDAPTGSNRSRACTTTASSRAAHARRPEARACPTPCWCPAANTASGHPVAVFGPQTGYFAPQLLMLQELQGPGISARGASFAGLSMYVELGRGQDYAWSATSAGQDIIDTYAVELCDPTARPPSSTHYLYHGTCTADGEAGAAPTPGSRPSPTPPPPAPTGCRSTARSTAR